MPNKSYSHQSMVTRQHFSPKISATRKQREEFSKEIKRIQLDNNIESTHKTSKIILITEQKKGDPNGPPFPYMRSND